MLAGTQERDILTPQIDIQPRRKLIRWKFPLAWYRVLTLAVAGAVWFLIVLGGLVRSTDSGRGCGKSWPLCEGSVLPRLEYHMMVEWTHRLFGVLGGLLMVVLGIVTLLWYRQPRRFLFLALAAGATYLLQAILGGITVLLNLDHTWVAMHMGNSMLLMGATILLALFTRLGAVPLTRDYPRLRWLAFGTLVWTYIAMFTGSWVVGAEATKACPSWPICSVDHILPEANFQQFVSFTHRVSVGFSDVLMLVLVVGIWRVRRSDKRLLNSSHVLAALYVSQVFVGAATVLLNAQEATKAMHLALAAATWACLCVMTMFVWLGPAKKEDKNLPPTPSSLRTRRSASIRRKGLCEATPIAVQSAVRSQEVISASASSSVSPLLLREGGRGVRFFQTIGDYIGLARLRVIPLLLVPTVAAMLIAAVQQPPTRNLFELIVLTILGGTLATGGAHTINQYIDRDIDAKMRRTKKRAVVTGKIRPIHALAFGIALSAVGVAELVLLVNPLAGLLSLSGNLFYIFVYTLWLKRTTVQNIVIGGAAGAVPPLVGWAAVTGDVGLPAILFFAIIFFWTPAHFWALALVRQEDYKAAGIPMLPAVKGEAATLRGILTYTVLLAWTTVLPFLLNALGLLYIIVAVVLGLIFVERSVSLLRKSSNQKAWKLFKFSNNYLALLYVAMVVDRVLSLGWRPLG